MAQRQRDRKKSSTNYGLLHRPRHRLKVLGALTLVLFLTVDDRHAGVVADGRQMAWTAIAIVETGGLGQARSRDLSFPRPEKGDAVSRYGMAMSLAQVPAAVAAPMVESAFGPGSSQPLFLVAPFAFVLLAALFAAAAARALGGSQRAETLVIVLATVGGPLAAYASLDLSEPLQAAALTAAYYFALTRRGLLAGVAAGIAVLTKSSLLAVAPLACLPLLEARDSDRRELLKGAAAFAAWVVFWFALEVIRFGRPFAAYGGEGFTHPLLDGAWRLLVGPNKGIVWFFPAVVAVVLASRHFNQRRLAVLGAVLPFAGLLALAAPWWSWDGGFGWGPRLLVPGVPLLGVLAGMEMSQWRAAARWALVGVSITANAPALLQNAVPVLNYQLVCQWPKADRDFARSVPSFARRATASEYSVVPAIVLSTVARAADMIVFPWLAYAVNSATAQLDSPPWLAARPDIKPVTATGAPLRAEEIRHAVHSGGWRFWGKGFRPTKDERHYGRVYDDGLIDQILRAQQVRDLHTAERLTNKLAGLKVEGLTDALVMENFRLARRQDDAARYLQSLPIERRRNPPINLVLALFERDDQREPSARAFLQSVSGAFPDSPVQRALSSPLSEWPSDFATMTEDISLQVSAK